MKLHQFNRKVLELKREDITMLKEFKESKFYAPIVKLVDDAWEGIVNNVIDDDDSKTIHMNRAAMKLIRRLRNVMKNVDSGYEKVMAMLNEPSN